MQRWRDMGKLSGTLAKFVYDDLVQKICQGNFNQGQKLPSEEELTHSYKVSRPVIRSALQQLRNDGFIESHRGLGSFVKRVAIPEVIQVSPIESYKDFLDCFDFRTNVEGQMAYYATLNATVNDKIKIQRAFNISEKHPDSFNQNEMDFDFAFHLAIAEATHNRFYYQTLQTIRVQILDGMSKISQYFSRDKAAHFAIKDREHGMILEAIIQGDANMAKAAMELHLTRSKHWAMHEE